MARRASRAAWAAGVVLGTAVLVVAAVWLLAPVLGYARTGWWPALLGPRNAVTWAAAVAAVLLLAIAGVRRSRPVVLPVALAVLVAAGASVVTILAHGVSTAAGAIAEPGRLRVFEWNTNGVLVAPEQVVAEALRHDANVLVLPDADFYRTSREYEQAFRDAGRSFTAFTTPGADPHLVVFVEGSLASAYRVAGVGPIADRTLELASTDASLPRIVALHAPIPSPTGADGWRATVQWAEARCASGSTIVVGDFNATADALGERLGRCADAALSLGAGSAGTWPMSLPTWLAMPIDHVFSAGIRPVGFEVLSPEAGSARHRATLTVLARED